MKLAEALKKHLEETPRKEIERAWAEAGERTKHVKGPTVKEYLEYVKKVNEEIHKNTQKSGDEGSENGICSHTE
jgi:hypothetical protein